jgi:hypothetical protein
MRCCAGVNSRASASVKLATASPMPMAAAATVKRMATRTRLSKKKARNRLSHCFWPPSAENGARTPRGEAVPDLYLRTLQRASQIAGGEQALAMHLKVTPSHLSLWLKGLERPTTEAFLRAVDLVSEYELAQLARKSEPEL